MRRDQLRGCMPAVIKAFLITECLLMSVSGDGGGPEDKIDYTFVFLGGGIGLFLAALFILSKICMIRKQAQTNFPELSKKRPSEVSQSSPEHNQLSLSVC